MVRESDDFEPTDMYTEEEEKEDESLLTSMKSATVKYTRNRTKKTRSILQDLIHSSIEPRIKTRADKIFKRHFSYKTQRTENRQRLIVGCLLMAIQELGLDYPPEYITMNSHLDVKKLVISKISRKVFDFLNERSEKRVSFTIIRDPEDYVDYYTEKLEIKHYKTTLIKLIKRLREKKRKEFFNTGPQNVCLACVIEMCNSSAEPLISNLKNKIEAITDVKFERLEKIRDQIVRD